MHRVYALVLTSHCGAQGLRLLSCPAAGTASFDALPMQCPKVQLLKKTGQWLWF